MLLNNKRKNAFGKRKREEKGGKIREEEVARKIAMA